MFYKLVKFYHNEGDFCMKIGRNELCPCGSGKKHKKCCMGRTSSLTEGLSTWKSNALDILNGKENAEVIADTMFSMLEVINGNEKYAGFCYASVAVLTILLREQGVHAVSCMGDVVGNGIRPFNHSWVEIDNEAYDVAILRPLLEGLTFPPVIRGYDVDTKKPTGFEYGISSGQPDTDEEAKVKRTPFKQYMDGWPVHPKGLWGLADILGNKLGLSVTSDGLAKKYSDIKWVIKNAEE